jgi:PhnB protein
MSTAITPYLFFAGRCAEAIDFYCQRLGATVLAKMHFNESPDPTPPGMLQAGFEDKIMHASLMIKGIPLMMSDGVNDRDHFTSFSLALSVDTEAEAQEAFNALADGGSVFMPLTKTFWSPCYGMLTDRFGLSWMVMVPGGPM